MAATPEAAARPLPYGRQLVDDDDIAAVVKVLRGDWLTQGPAVEAFEAALCEATGARHAVAVSSGTAALHLACLAAGVSPGDTGITPAITFVASANCVRYAGGEPVLCDVEPDTGLISLEHLQALVARRRPKVILPVDFAGTPAPLPEIQEIARDCGAVVVEDAAHALGATYRHVGEEHRSAGCRHADMAILSFHPVKHVTTGEGGAITTNDEGLATALRELRTHGITKDPSRLQRSDGPWYQEQHALGFNYRLTDIQCALGCSQLQKLGRYVARRRELAARYDAGFAEPGLTERLRPLSVPDWASSSYHLYVVRLRPRARESLTDLAERRRALFLALRDQGIFPQVHYIPVPRQPDFERHGLGNGSFAGADAYYAGCLSLPLFPGMVAADVDRIIAAVAGALA